jgi:hypothetical protein
MRKTLWITGAILLVGSTMVSCKADYVCKCTKTYTTDSGSTTENYAVYTYHDNRVRAEERCNDNTSTGSDLWGDYSINCTIQ